MSRWLGVSPQKDEGVMMELELSTSPERGGGLETEVVTHSWAGHA